MQAVASMGTVLSGGSIVDLDGTFFVQIIIFFVAFFILKGLVFGPVMKVMDAREAAVTGAREQAVEMEAETARRKADFEAQLRKIREQGTRERDAQRAEAQKLARAFTDKARAENTATLAAARQRLADEADKARSAMQPKIPQLAHEIASRLLGRSVN